MIKRIFVASLVFFCGFSFTGMLQVQNAAAAEPKVKDIILATTTSTVDSGLLDVLIPKFEKETGYRVKTISAGTGQALAMGEKGRRMSCCAMLPPPKRSWWTKERLSTISLLCTMIS